MSAKRSRRPKLIGIYRISSSKTNKIYIGSSRDIAMRLGAHLIELISGTHHNKSLQTEFNRYGVASLSFSIVLVLDSSISAAALRKVEQAEMDVVDIKHLHNQVRASKRKLAKAVTN